MRAIRRLMRLRWFQGMLWGLFCACIACSNMTNGQEPAIDAQATPTPAKTPSKVVDISAENFNFNKAQKIITYSGNVKVVQQETTLFSDRLEAHLDESGRQIAKTVASGNVRIASSSGMATGEQGIFYNTEQKIELIGNAKVWQDNNTVTAQRIVAFLQEKVVEAYADEAKTDSRVVMTIYSTGEFSNPFEMMSGATETPQPEPLAAQPTAEATVEKKEDAPKGDEKATPAVITSKTLRLNDNEHRAIFTGDVVAKKPPTELRADEMIVYIMKTPDNRNDIEKIDVSGHVKVTHETTVITGETGEFLNKAQKATVRGTPEKKAHVDDSAQNLTMDALIITANLATGEIGATGAATQVEPENETEEPGKERIHMQFGVDDAQTMLDQPATQPTTYSITEESVAKFRQEKIPDATIEKLSPLKNQMFSHEADFLKAVEDAIGKELTAKYKKALLKHSAKVEKTTEKGENPSVTIYPKKGK
ncbi:cell envelope biogenesis ABC transporter, periplasmic protein [Candidatus Moduliflexus flocculans]|uniref:Cell envelope biogenesis ABC transporter, periplasmic protein n=1 Tax=Candidatus Moduliflexus flocculans TaxID=1499966 RepID=A0A0S6W311_9BACT|nr:cell envelope biogenesis ABC transporter, periplasmic protein [Candidatus Moduliflexus flocculans]